MNTDRKYNGWANYETWCVNLWIGEDSSNYWNETASEVYSESQADTCFSRAERATLDLADRLKAEIEESLPELGASMASDLLGAAMSEVNWYEIAEHFIEDAQTDAELNPDVILSDAQTHLEKICRADGGKDSALYLASFDILAHARAQVEESEIAS